MQWRRGKSKLGTAGCRLLRREIDLGLAGQDEKKCLRTEMTGAGDGLVDKVSATQA